MDARQVISNIDIVCAQHRFHSELNAIVLRKHEGQKECVLKAWLHVHHVVSWHMRSTGQIRRFEAARFAKGDGHGTQC